MGPLGDVGSPGQLAGQAWLVHTPGHPAVLLQHSPPPPNPDIRTAAQLHPPRDCHPLSGGGKVPGCALTPSVPGHGASRTRQRPRLNPVLGLPPLPGVGVLQLLCSPGAATRARLHPCFPLTSPTSLHPRGQAAARLAPVTAPGIPTTSLQSREWGWKAAASAAPHLHGMAQPAW